MFNMKNKHIKKQKGEKDQKDYLHEIKRKLGP